MLTYLKQHPRSYHHAREQSLDIFERCTAPDMDRRVLARFYGFYTLVEEVLLPFGAKARLFCWSVWPSRVFTRCNSLLSACQRWNDSLMEASIVGNVDR